MAQIFFLQMGLHNSKILRNDFIIRIFYLLEGGFLVEYGCNKRERFFSKPFCVMSPEKNKNKKQMMHK